MTALFIEVSILLSTMLFYNKTLIPQQAGPKHGRWKFIVHKSDALQISNIHDKANIHTQCITLP